MVSNKPVALVTGGRRGIGFAIARILAENGFDIAIGDIVEAAEAAEAVKELEKTGAAVLYCKADVSVGEDRERMVRAIEERFGRIDVLVNNAGVAPKVRADILEATEESFDRLIAINLKGPYFLTQRVARWMIDLIRKGEIREYRPCVVNIGSISAWVASTSRGDYCISKAGVAMATKLWAARLGEFGIGVYEIQPGIIKTDMTAAVQEKYDKLIAEGLLVQSRWGQPEDVAKAVLACVKGLLAYSTGQVIYVDGGFHVARL